MKCNNCFKQFPLKNFVIYDINGVEKKNLCCPDCKKLENKLIFNFKKFIKHLHY